jgi:hypothetical protein
MNKDIMTRGRFLANVGRPLISTIRSAAQSYGIR